MVPFLCVTIASGLSGMDEGNSFAGLAWPPGSSSEPNQFRSSATCTSLPGDTGETEARVRHGQSVE